MERHLEVQERLEQFFDDTPDTDNINLESLRELLLSDREQREVAAIVYVLSHVRPFDLEAQDVYSPTGVKTLRRIATLRDRVKTLTGMEDPLFTPGPRASKHDVRLFDIRLYERLPALRQRDATTVHLFANTLLKEL